MYILVQIIISRSLQTIFQIFSHFIKTANHFQPLNDHFYCKTLPLSIAQYPLEEKGYGRFYVIYLRKESVRLTKILELIEDLKKK